MKSFILKFSSVFFLSFILFSCASSDENDELYIDTVETIEVSDVTYTSLEKEILDLVNNYRVSLNLNELEILDLVSNVAEAHTEYMIENGQLSHDNFSERAQYLMDNANAKSVSENVAYGYTCAQDVFDGWLSSDSHREAIEKSTLTHFGISTESSESGRYYFTNIFIKK